MAVQASPYATFGERISTPVGVIQSSSEDEEVKAAKLERLKEAKERALSFFSWAGKKHAQYPGRVVFTAIVITVLTAAAFIFLAIHFWTDAHPIQVGSNQGTILDCTQQERSICCRDCSCIRNPVRTDWPCKCWEWGERGEIVIDGCVYTDLTAGELWKNIGLVLLVPAAGFAITAIVMKVLRIGAKRYFQKQFEALNHPTKKTALLAVVKDEK